YTRNNENGVAMIDPFESVDAVVGVSLDAINWFPSSRPMRNNNDLGTAFTDRRFNIIESVQMDNHLPPDGTTTNKQKTQLQMRYANMDTPDRWDAFVYSFGPSYNQSIPGMNQLEVWYATDQ